MGTWNIKPFGNDTAGDWLWKLEKTNDESVIKSAFEVVIDGEAIPDASDCEEAIAAAAVVEAARHQPLGKLPPEAKRWVSERGFVPADSLVKHAITAIKKIIAKSELRELWSESSHSPSGRSKWNCYSPDFAKFKPRRRQRENQKRRLRHACCIN